MDGLEAGWSQLPAHWQDTTLAHLLLVPNPPQHPQGDFGLRDGVVLDEIGERYTFTGTGLIGRIEPSAAVKV